MRFVPTLTLRRQLGLFALGAALLVACMGGVQLWSSQRLASQIGAMQEHRLKPLVQLDRVGRAIERQRAAVLATLASTNDVMQEALDKQVEQDRRELPAILQSLREAEPGEAERALLGELAAAVDKAQVEGLAEVLDRLHKGQFAEADIAAQRTYRPRVDVATRALDKVIGAHVERAQRDYEAAAARLRGEAVGVAAGVLVALLGGLGFAVLIDGALRRVLGADERVLAEGARELAQGRLAHRIAVRAGDRASVASRLNEMSQDMAQLVGEVSTGSAEVVEVSSRLSRSSEDLALRTSGEASSLEQTAASMEELATVVTRNTELAEKASARSSEVAALAVEGGRTMTQLRETMDALVASEKEVADIVATIDGIAFQTNLLALNAAVEAARAGEQGRGFAVVAAEVRSLSQRSAAAAREIRTLVHDSVSRAQGGHALVGRAADSMQSIIGASHGASEAIVGMARASREQAGAIIEVNRAVEQLDQAVQHNAQLAEATSRDALRMEESAGVLVAAVRRFDTGAEHAPAAPAPVNPSDLGSLAMMRAPKLLLQAG